jgi:fructose-1,6-bisphosphatase/inositol monophosphatase family enzyme
MIPMSISIDELKDLGLKVYEKVHPILGTESAAKALTRGAGGDITMHIDTLAENTIINGLKEFRTNLLFISEEVGEKYIGSREEAVKNNHVLIVDPIDGSNNSVRGIPYSSVSIAYAEGTHMRDIIKAAIVNLYTKDIYWAEKGQGAFMNDHEIHVSDLGISDKPFFEINIAPHNIKKNLEHLEPIISKFHRIRILGSTALSLCQIASGSMEVFLDFRTTNRLVDTAAGYLILKEAGGKIFSFEGTEIDFKLGINVHFPFIACNPHMEAFLRQKFVNK